MCILSQYLPAPPRKYCAKRNPLQHNKCQLASDNWRNPPVDCPFPICGNSMIRPQEEFLIKCLEIFWIWWLPEMLCIRSPHFFHLRYILGNLLCAKPFSGLLENTSERNKPKPEGPLWRLWLVKERKILQAILVPDDKPRLQGTCAVRKWCRRSKLAIFRKRYSN